MTKNTGTEPSNPQANRSGVIRLRGANIQRQAVCFLGVLPDDPDHLPTTPPTGFIWMQGGAWMGDAEEYGIANVRIGFKEKRLDFTITLADAIDLADLIAQTISEMQEACDD